MVDVTAGDFDRLFDDAFSAIKPLVDPDEGQAEESEPIRGAGEAMDGYIKVTAKPGGQLETVEINPRALRSDSESIAQAFLEATNIALQDLQEKLANALPDMPDQKELMEQLKEFQNQSVLQMQRYLTAITDVQDTIERGMEAD